MSIECRPQKLSTAVRVGSTLLGREILVALSQHERLILAELEAQVSHTRLKAILRRLQWGKPVVEPALLAIGLLLIVLSLAVWWPLAPVGYGLAAFSAVRLGRAAKRHKLVRSHRVSGKPTP
jgi:hypothetical protein